MKRTLIGFALAAATVPLAGCAEDYYGVGYDTGYGYDTGWYSYPYSVWYDGYYGPFYDGYWGLDGFFYFRLFANDNHYRRGEGRHFHHDRPPNGDHYHHYDGQTQRPPASAQLPRYPVPPAVHNPPPVHGNPPPVANPAPPPVVHTPPPVVHTPPPVVHTPPPVVHAPPPVVHTPPAGAHTPRSDTPKTPDGQRGHRHHTRQ
ncbi:MAG: hypothetical protein ACXWI4_09115 [Croceibacterium sp.]